VALVCLTAGRACDQHCNDESPTRTAATPTSEAIRPVLRRPGWKGIGAARRDLDIDWIVVCMHQVAISTADMFNGADLGIREEWCRCSTDTESTSWCWARAPLRALAPDPRREQNATLTPVVANCHQ